MLKPVSFIYVRHGETDWNREHRMQGQIDIPLNAMGLQQAEQARDRLAHLGIGTICTSPLSRARVTAEIIAQKQDCPIIEIEALKEVSMGPYEGQFKGSWWDDWYAGNPVEGTELKASFIRRVVAGINHALDHAGPVLIVAHGGTYRAVNHHVPGSPDAAQLGNAVPVRHDAPLAPGGAWGVEIFA